MAVTETSGIRCTPRMIHNYEFKGLIDEPERSAGGIRLYPVDYIGRIARIKKLQHEYNLSLAAIRGILHRSGVRDIKGDVAGVLAESRFTKHSKPETEPKRDTIVRAAESILRARGYQKTTIDEIASEAGVAKGTFYLYFKSKQQLLIEVLDRAVDSLEDRLQRSLVGVSDPIERLEKMALSYMRGYLRYRELIHILYGESVGGNAQFRHEFRRIYERITSDLRGDLKELIALIEDGESYVDPELLAYAMVGAGEMLAYRAELDDRYSLEDVVEKAFELIKVGSLRAGGPKMRATVDGKEATDRTVINLQREGG